MAYWLGIDVGGTNLKAALVDDAGDIVVERVQDTPQQGSDAIIDVLVQLIRDVAADGRSSLPDLGGIGVGTPGPLDFDSGTVLNAPNLPGWANLPLRARLEEATGRPVVLENDANAAAYGEYRAARRHDPTVTDLVMVTLGTGIGTGLVVEGRVVHGGFGLAGEAGHMIVETSGRPCACGQRGCIEAYASAASVVRRTREALDAGEPSSLGALTGPFSTRDIFQAVEAGDALASRIADETAHYLGAFCVSLCRVLDPQRIVFGGGLAEAGLTLLERIRAAFDTLDWRLVPAKVQLVSAELGTRAGVIGAAALAQDQARY